MWSKSIEFLNPYEAIKADIEKGVYDEENLSWTRSCGLWFVKLKEMLFL